MRTSDVQSILVRRNSDRRRDPIGHVQDILFDLRDHSIVAYLVRDAGWRGASLGVFTAEELRITEGAAELSLSESEIAERRERMDLAVQNETVPLTALPPILVGPFGYTVSPALAIAALNSLAARRAEERPAGEDKAPSWYWATPLLGKPVFDTSGEIGSLIDLEFSETGGRLRALNIREGTGLVFEMDANTLNHIAPNSEAVIVQSPDHPSYNLPRFSTRKTSVAGLGLTSPAD